MSNRAIEKKIDAAFLWIKHNKDQIIIGSSVVLFLILLVPLSIEYKARQFNTVIEEYTTVQSYFYSGQYEKAVEKADGLLVKNNKKNNINKLTLFFKGNALYSLGDFDKAEEVYKKLLKKYSNDYLSANFLDSLAYSYEMKAEYLKAIDTWYKIINDYQDSYLVPNAYKSIARNYELFGDFTKAEEIYQLINNMFDNTRWDNFAKQRLDFLTNKNR